MNSVANIVPKPDAASAVFHVLTVTAFMCVSNASNTFAFWPEANDPSWSCSWVSAYKVHPHKCRIVSEHGLHN